MANGNNSADDSKFSFGTQELRQARRAEHLSLQQPVQRKPPGGGAGFDPYNTSGSFDRRKHWERVGKR